MALPQRELPKQGSIYTLAQSETINGSKPVSKRVYIVSGEGSDLSNVKAMQGRAKCKTITQRLALSLIAIEEKNGDSESAKSYWNTFYCQNEVVTANGRLYGKYCKNRFCTVCNRIRKAQIINTYKPFIELWPDPQFLTLTVKSVSKGRLKQIINSMLNCWRTILRKYKKRGQRGTGIKLIGIKTLECCFNSVKRTYNPHFHILVPDLATAEIIRREWIARAKPGWVSSKAQEIRKVKNTEADLIEVIKYGVKVFMEPDPNKKGIKTDMKIFPAAYRTILNAMQGHRIFERFGFNVATNRCKDGGKYTLVVDFKQWKFEASRADWYEKTSDKPLTCYLMPEETRSMITHNFDFELD